MDGSCREGDKPKLQSGGWVTSKKDRRERQVVQESPVAIPISNKYAVLENVGGDELSGECSTDSQVSGTETGSNVMKGMPGSKLSIYDRGVSNQRRRQ
eukprot:g29772.t1